MKKLIRVIGILSVALLFAGCAMNTSLHIPASEGDFDRVRAEIEGGKDVDSKDAAGQTALMYAAETGRMEIVKYLVSKGADVNAKSRGFGRGTALIYAAASNRTEVMKYLLAQGADIDAVSNHNETALIWASAQGHTDAVKLLLDKGADANIKNKKDQTALDIAKSLNRQEVVKLLE